ncbi:MAG: MCE family protein [Solirubrobacteraceae bacterium]|nr:MCE family protein [Solirubrobacteraceae bacterium]
MRTSTNRPLLLGVLLLAFAVGAAYWAITRPKPLNRSERVVVVVDDVAGIGLVQRDVRMAGVRVGRIGAVERVGDDAKVTLLLDEPVGTIHRDATVAIRPHTAFEGTAYADLDPGSPSAPVLGDAVIPRSRTSVYVSLDRAVSGFQQPAREDVADVLDETSRALDAKGAAAAGHVLEGAPRLLRGTGAAARAMRGQRGDELHTAIRGMQQTVDAITSAAPVDDYVAKVDTTLAALTVDNAKPLDEILQRAAPVLERVRSAGPRADRVLRRTSRLARVTEPQLHEIAPTLVVARSLLATTRQQLPSLPETLDRSASILMILAGAAPGLERSVGSIARTVEVTRRSLVPAMLSQTFSGMPAYAQMLAAAAGMTGSMSAFQTKEQNPNGWGYGFRGLFDFGESTAGPTKPEPLSEGG